MGRLKIKQTEDQKVFYFSDPHYYHANMVRAISQWTDKENSTRDFDSIDEMNNAIVNSINKTVRKNDILFCLGDWSFGNKKYITEFRRRIHCKNVHLIFGNHDEEIEEGTISIHEVGELCGKTHDDAELGRKVRELLNSEHNLSGHFSSVQHYKEVAVDGIMICMFHYKQTIWNKSHRDAYHLYGHSHSMAEHLVNGKSMDVGVDNAFKLLGEYRPFSHEEILHFLGGRKAKVIDHHGAKGTESHK